MPLVRLVLAVSALVVALLAFRLLTSASGEADQVPLESATDVSAVPIVDSAARSAPDMAARMTTLDDLGAPDDPLPEPLALLATGEPVQSDQDAEALARRVLDGSPDAFPALITALQASGIGIVGPDNASVVKPAEPWQGITMQRWEVRTAAAMVLPERSVAFTLTDLTAFLVDVIPQLKGAPVEQLIASDLRALAESQVPTRRFFGRFIAALGRNATSHAPYDLLGDVDPQAIRLDGLQASLILRRLAIDIVMLTADPKRPGTQKKTAWFLDTLHEWVSPTVFAQGTPCRMSESTQTAMDIAAFGSSMAWGGFAVGEMGMGGFMQRVGISELGPLAAVASTLLAYAQFIATYAALEADVTMDAPPLVRTKKQSPQTGERRQLTAVVKMNIGNAEMLNCFRALLIAVGLDFSLPNDGPVKGARVDWYGVEGFDQSAAVLHGGPEAIVMFETDGASSSSANRVRDAVTGEDGKVHVGVAGRGQHENLSNDATEVHKSAKVRLEVALKGADLFGDLQEAAGTAAGGLAGLASLPLGILTRARWASVGHHRFPVIDWREGPGEWSGTIAVVETTIVSSSGSAPFDRGGHTSQETETSQLTVQVTETLNDQSAGSVVASLKGTVEARFNRQKTWAGWTLQSCGRVSGRRMNGSSRESVTGSGTTDATMMVGIQEDGTYVIAASLAELRVPTEGRTDSEGESFGQACAVNAKSSSMEHAPSDHSFGGAIQVSGRVDPRNPNVLSGSRSEEFTPEGVSEGTRSKRVKTTTWELKRN